MKRLVLVVAAIAFSGATAFAAARPVHPSTVRVRRPRVAAAMAVHVHPFGHAAVRPILPHRTAGGSGWPTSCATACRYRPRPVGPASDSS